MPTTVKRKSNMFKSHYSAAVREFAIKAGQRIDADYWDRELRDFRRRLIKEEFEELEYELFRDRLPNDREMKVNAAKEMADLLYVVFGAAEALNIPIDEVFRRVHENNMTKFVPDENGNFQKRADGKIVKRPGHKPVDLSDLFND